jgi:hypothetical protein
VKKLYLIFIVVILLALPALAADTLTVAEINLDGTTATLSAAADDSNYVANNGKTWIQVTNTNASPCTLTVYSKVSTWQSLPEGLAASNLTVIVPETTGNKIIGPFNPRAWNNTTGYLLFKCSHINNISVGAFKLP